MLSESRCIFKHTKEILFVKLSYQLQLLTQKLLEGRETERLPKIEEKLQ